jgi:hypothetical protein
MVSYGMVYRYSDSTSPINGKQVLGPSQISGKFELTFDIRIRRQNKNYRSYLVLMKLDHHDHYPPNLFETMSEA